MSPSKVERVSYAETKLITRCYLDKAIEDVFIKVSYQKIHIRSIAWLDKDTNCQTTNQRGMVRL